MTKVTHKPSIFCSDVHGTLNNRSGFPVRFCLAFVVSTVLVSFFFFFYFAFYTPAV